MEDDEFVSDSELTSYVNASLKELFDILVTTFSDYYTATPLEFTLTNSTDGYSLPSDFYKLRALDRSYDNSGSSSSWWDVPSFNFKERNKYNQMNSIQGTVPFVKYRIMGATGLTGNGDIKFIPPGNAAGLYRLWYIPKCPDLVDDTDEFQGVNGYEEYIIVDCCIKMLTKQEDDVSVFVMQKAELLKRIEAAAAERDAGEPQRITDLRGNNSGAWGGNGFGW